MKDEDDVRTRRLVLDAVARDKDPVVLVTHGSQTELRIAAGIAAAKSAVDGALASVNAHPAVPVYIRPHGHRQRHIVAPDGKLIVGQGTKTACGKFFGKFALALTTDKAKVCDGCKAATAEVP